MNRDDAKLNELVLHNEFSTDITIHNVTTIPLAVEMLGAMFPGEKQTVREFSDFTCISVGEMMEKITVKCFVRRKAEA